MPDIQTALQKAIDKLAVNKEKQMNQAQSTHSNELTKLANDWASDDPAEPKNKLGVSGNTPQTYFKTTTNVTRSTFDMVKANPGLKQAAMVKLMEARGFKGQSVATLMVQMTKVGILRRDEDGLYYANQSSYSPIKPSALRKAREKTQRKNKPAVKANVVDAAKRPYVKTGMYAKKKDEGIAALGAQPSGVVEVKAAPTAYDPDQLLATLSFTQAITLYKKLKQMIGEV